MCDDIRPEISGKATLVGFAGVLPLREILIQNLALPIPQFTFLFVLDSSVGNAAIQMELKSPHGATIAKSPQMFLQEVNANGHFNVAFGIRNVLLRDEGVYRVQLFASESIVYEEVFNAKQGRIPTLGTPIMQ